jgi:hypothetical protein
MDLKKKGAPIFAFMHQHFEKIPFVFLSKSRMRKSVSVALGKK